MNNSIHLPDEQIPSSLLSEVVLADRYHMLSMLGSGGMGTVFKAQHLAMERPVAVKLMHKHMVCQPEALKDFYEEARVIAQIKHHNIVTLYDFGISKNDQPFIVMDYIEGPSLRDLLNSNNLLTLQQLKTILHQITDGLIYAHQAGVIHKDLKPENILFAHRDLKQIILVDFGLAALANNDHANKKIIGSPYYMSPEQCLLNSCPDNRSDIYSLAIVLYEALSGALPYEKKSSLSMLNSHLHEEARPFHLNNAGLQVCTELTEVFSIALAKEPNKRYQTMSDFSADFERALAKDIAKLKLIQHRDLVAKQTLSKTPGIGKTMNVQLRLENNKDFLVNQASLEAAVYVDQTQQLPADLIENKFCRYCQSAVPVHLQFCLTCQRPFSAAKSTYDLAYIANNHPGIMAKLRSMMGYLITFSVLATCILFMLAR